MNENSINKISKLTVDRYSERFQKLRHDIKTLGWGSEQQQEYRFSQIVDHLSFDSKSVLDIGCGFGDFYLHLKHKECQIEKYTGWDITPEFIEESKVKDAAVDLEIRNLAKNPPLEEVADIGVMIGLLNWKLESEDENYQYTEMMMRNAFAATRQTLAVDFLSTQYTPDYPVEDCVFYHDPAKVLEVAFQLSPNVDLVHSYSPIPQREFFVLIHK